MPKKTEPRRDWGFKPTLVSQEEQEQREKVLKLPEKHGMNLTPQQHEHYANTMYHFIADNTQYANPPKRSEVKAALQEIMDGSQKFVDAIKHIDYATCRLMEYPYEDFKKAAKLVKSIRYRARLAMLGLKPHKGGRPEDFVLKRTIVRLAKTYEAGKKGKNATVTYDPYADDELYSGAFFAFVDDWLTTLGYPPSSNSSLGTATKRALEKRSRYSAS